MSLGQSLRQFFGDRLREGVPLRDLSWIKIGGEAPFFIETMEVNDVIVLHKMRKQYGFSLFYLGRGTNLCFYDGQLEGVFVKMPQSDKRYTVEGEDITFYGNTFLSSAHYLSIQEGLEGLEYGVGIPGTVAGAVKMNAGTREGDTASVLKSVALVDENGLRNVGVENLGMTYRHSNIGDAFIYQATFALKKVSEERREFLKKKSRVYLTHRNQHQPLDKPTLGSTFKNPPGDFAGRLIEACGLKGFRLGDLSISTQHANFLINEGQATGQEMHKMLTFIRRRVREQFGVILELEIKLIGFPPL